MIASNDFSKKLSILFNALQVIVNYIKSLSNHKRSNLALIPLFSVCLHGETVACSLCAEAAVNTALETQKAADAAAQAAAETAEVAARAAAEATNLTTQVAQKADIGACTHQ